MKYRKEIDGLRALAVVPVILFHAGFSSFSGGFVGVDVFFVIIGYLITSKILEYLRENKFRIRDFYERRARRILPALYLTIFFCLPFAWMWLQPADLRHFGKSIAAVVLFISNFLFQKGGYFEASSELMPLLHTWSLAIEEQYYIFFPIILVLTYKKRSLSTILVLSVLGIASLLFAQWETVRHPEQAFFMLPSRVWELLIGAITAIVIAPTTVAAKKKFFIKNWLQFKPLQQVASFAGLFLILIAIAFFNKTTPFPGVWALPPTLGVIFIIIFATPETFVGKLLGSKPFVGFGVISYSAYLFHQPILAFARYRFPGEINELALAGLVLINFGLAFLSWKFVETPFRNREIISTKKLLWSSIVSACLLLISGILIRSYNGFPERFSTMKGFYADSQWEDALNKNEDCYKQFGGDQYCQITAISSPVTDALIGDSHSNHFFPGLSSYLAKSGRNLLQQGAGACPPFLYIDTGKHPIHGLLKCAERTSGLYQSIMDSKTINTVYLAFHHSRYFNKSIYSLYDLRNEIHDEDRLEFLSKALIRTINSFESKGKEVRLIYDLPDLKEGQPLTCLLAEERDASINECNNPKLFIGDYEDYNKLLSKIAKKQK